MAQAKLSLGFRTGVNSTGGMYPALLVFNAIFGGGPSSKLFNNVRERLSLAYYVSSRADGFKGIMTVNSGIEAENFQKAFDEIMNQLDQIQKGDITDSELSAAILTMVNSLRSISDSALATEDYWLGRLMIGKHTDIEHLIQCLQRVTVQEVTSIANETALDTVYFLKGREAEAI